MIAFLALCLAGGPLAGPPTADPPTEDEVLKAIGEADPGQLAALEAVSKLDPEVADALEAIAPDELDALMAKRARGEELSAEEAALVEANVRVSVAGFDARLHYENGRIAIGDGLATLALGSEFRYLAPEDATTVLSQAWGNPDADDNLGMIVPADVSVVHPFDGWGVRVDFRADGYVAEDGPAEIDPDAALATLREQIELANAARKKAGAAPMRVVGWERAPAYDPTTHTMTWAVEYADEDPSSPNSLNYTIRILARRGVLDLSLIATVEQRELVLPVMDRLPSLVEFEDGQRYEDFDPSSDPKAPYSLENLLAGGGPQVDGLSALKRFAPLGLLLLVLAALKLRARRED